MLYCKYICYLRFCYRVYELDAVHYGITGVSTGVNKVHYASMLVFCFSQTELLCTI